MSNAIVHHSCRYKHWKVTAFSNTRSICYPISHLFWDCAQPCPAQDGNVVTRTNPALSRTQVASCCLSHTGNAEALLSQVLWVWVCLVLRYTVTSPFLFNIIINLKCKEFNKEYHLHTVNLDSVRNFTPVLFCSVGYKSKGQHYFIINSPHVEH